MLDEEKLLAEFAEITVNEEVDNVKNTNRLSKQEKAVKYFEKVKQSRLAKRSEERKRQRPGRKRKNREEKPVLPHQLNIAIDLSFEGLMNQKESTHLARQLGRIWGLQKHYQGLKTELYGLTPLFSTNCQQVVTGFEKFDWKTHEQKLQDVVDIADRDTLVYLTPDADAPPLLELDKDKVYVIGGIVDETGVGSRTKMKADSSGHKSYRLPIREFSQRTTKPGNWTFNQMLALNQVVEGLCIYTQTSDWKTALGAVVPARTGFIFEKD